MMNSRTSLRAAGLLIALLAPFATAHAQLSGLLQQSGSGSVNGDGSGALGAVAGALGGSTSAGAAGSGSGALSGAGALLGDGSSNGGGALSALGGGGDAASLLSGSSSSNVAGLLQFCVQNNYLGGTSGVASVQQSLMGKLGGGASSDSGYSSGASGILQGSGGTSLDLSGGGVKQAVTKQVCNKVLAQAKGML
jgi:hypothetical protein